MALTIASAKIPGLEEPERIGRYNVITREWTLSGTYDTGGHIYTAAQLVIPRLNGLVEIDFPSVTFRNGTAFIVPYWNRATGAIFFAWTGAVVSTALAEVTNGANLANYVGRVRVRHIG